jgi:mannose-1-phosphate guanylyltransferase
MSHRYVIIIAGGAGTRLWPLSRSASPKQFQKLTGELTLIQHMASLAKQVVPVENLCVMTVDTFADTVREQLPDMPAENILTEPARRDNGPAIALAMLSLQARDPKATVAILWSDHLIKDAEQFERALSAAFEAAEDKTDHMVTFGANPTAPETGFGYIEMGESARLYSGVSVFQVKRFVEKPDKETAQKFIRSWQYLWNIGYEVMNVGSFVGQLSEMHPELVPVFDELRAAAARSDRTALAEAYEKMPKLSIEFLFTQQLKNILVVPADMGWSDVGNWNILHEVLQEGEDTMVTRGSVIQVSSDNCLVMAKDRPIALVGVKDLVIIDAGDSILVMHKNAAQDMKTLNAKLAETNQNLL